MNYRVQMPASKSNMAPLPAGEQGAPFAGVAIRFGDNSMFKIGLEKLCVYAACVTMQNLAFKIEGGSAEDISTVTTTRRGL